MPTLSNISFYYKLTNLFQLSWKEFWAFFFDNPYYLPLVFLAFKTLIKTGVLLFLNNRFWKVFSPMLQSFGADITFISLSWAGGCLINYSKTATSINTDKDTLYHFFFLLILIYLIQFSIFKLQERMGNRRDKKIYFFRYEIEGMRWKTIVRFIYIFTTYIIGYYFYMVTLSFIRN